MIDQDKMRALAKRVLETMDKADNGEFGDALFQYRAATNPETILALLDRLEAAAAFIQDVSKQKPEKPDYWSSCGQCERNIDQVPDGEKFDAIIDRALAVQKSHSVQQTRTGGENEREAK